MATMTALADTERYLLAYERLAAELPAGEGERLRTLRREGIERFSALGFPTSRWEEWRFTHLAPLVRTPFALDAATDGLKRADTERFLHPGCDHLVLVDGRFSPALSRLAGLPRGVVATGLAEAIERHPERVEPHLGRLARVAEQPFVALNTALWRDGAFVWLPRGTVAERPIEVLSIGRSHGEPHAFFPRLLVVAEEGSQCRIVEHCASAGEGPYLHCAVTELAVGPGAVVDHYKLQRESSRAFHMGALGIRQDRGSSLSSQTITWGGAITRNDIGVVLAGEGGDAILNGLYVVDGEQLVDTHMRVEHAAPHCGSHELYKGILDGRSRAVFSGRIYVHPGAQKTDAKQTNRNLLLSREALCNSNPQLEIFADDVKCTHGSTVGQLDANAVFYLRSRGIGEDAARSLLTYAFAEDIVQRIQIEPVRRDVEEFLFRHLPMGEVVRQAV